MKGLFVASDLLKHLRVLQADMLTPKVYLALELVSKLKQSGVFFIVFLCGDVLVRFEALVNDLVNQLLLSVISCFLKPVQVLDHLRNWVNWLLDQERFDQLLEYRLYFVLKVIHFLLLLLCVRPINEHRVLSLYEVRVSCNLCLLVNCKVFEKKQRLVANHTR